MIKGTWSGVACESGWQCGGREGHSMNMVGRRAFVFGGVEGGRRVNSTAVFDLQLSPGAGGGTAGLWTLASTTGSVPSPRCHHASWVLGDFLLVHGGEAATDVGGGSSSNAPPRADAVGSASTTTFKDTLDNGRGRMCLDDLLCLDTNSMVWSRVQSGLAPLPRKGHSATVVSVPRNMFSAGAIDEPAPPGLGAAAAAAVEPHVFLFGGAPHSGASPSSELFVANAQRLVDGGGFWSKLDAQGTAPHGRYGHAMIATCGVSDDRQAGGPQGGESTPQLLLFGGTAGSGLLFNDLHLYDTARNTWTQFQHRGRPPSARYGHTVSVSRLVCQQVPSAAAAGGRAAGGGSTAVKKSAAACRANDVALVFGGVSRAAGGESSFCRDLFSLDLHTMQWSEVRLGYNLPNARYGHTMAFVAPPPRLCGPGIPSSTGQRSSKGVGHAAAGSVDQQPGTGGTADPRGVRWAAMLQQGEGAGGGASNSTPPFTENHMIMFGGINSMYCNSEVWMLALKPPTPEEVEKREQRLEIEREEKQKAADLRRGGTRSRYKDRSPVRKSNGRVFGGPQSAEAVEEQAMAAKEGNNFGTPARSGKENADMTRTELDDEIERAMMRARKEKLEATAELALSQGQNRTLAADLATERAQVARLNEALEAANASRKSEVAALQMELGQQTTANTVLTAEVDDMQELLGLMDLSANLRFGAWLKRNNQGMASEQLHDVAVPTPLAKPPLGQLGERRGEKDHSVSRIHGDFTPGGVVRGQRPYGGPQTERQRAAPHNPMTSGGYRGASLANQSR